MTSKNNSAPHPRMNHVRKAGYQKPGDGHPIDPEDEDRPMPRLPELQFLKHRLPGEPKDGPWK